MAPFVRGKGFKSAAAFSRTGGKRLILRLPGQLCLIALPDGLVEAGRADRLHRLRAELFPGHEKIERAELPRMAALLLRKAQQPLPRAFRCARGKCAVCGGVLPFSLCQRGDGFGG